MLMQRRGPGDHERAAALLDEAIALARDFGFVAIERLAQRTRDQIARA